MSVETEATSVVALHAHRLRESGARTLTGVVSDSGGVLRGKTVPAARIEVFAEAGMGASYTWPVFCVDNSIAATPELNVVGDFRLVADLETAVVLDGGFGWAAADLCDQDGRITPYCWRSLGKRQTHDLLSRGVSVAVGHELEFILLEEDGTVTGHRHGWQAYGVRPYSQVSDFGADLCEALAVAGLPVEQIHAEYGPGQFEISLPPRDPVAAADGVLLARAVVGRTAARHGLHASFSPAPVPGQPGNGAHLHLSFSDAEGPLLSGGGGAAGLTLTGEHALAGIIEHLPDMMAVLAGTVVSGERMQPGHWSGAFACWGVENREAAVRLLLGNRGNPRGAHLEVKCVDPGANPYLATALLLAAAGDGIARQVAAPAAVSVDPATLVAGGAGPAVRALPRDPSERLDRFAASAFCTEVLGAPLHGAVVSVRRQELPLCDDQSQVLATRFAWSS